MAIASMMLCLHGRGTLHRQSVETLSEHGFHERTSHGGSVHAPHCADGRVGTGLDRACASVDRYQGDDKVRNDDNGSRPSDIGTDSARKFFPDSESGTMGSGNGSYMGGAHSVGGHRPYGGTGSGFGSVDRHVNASGLRSDSSQESWVSWLISALVIGLPIAVVIFHNLMVMSEQNQQVRWRLERIAAWARYAGEYAIWIGKKTWK